MTDWGCAEGPSISANFPVGVDSNRGYFSMIAESICVKDASRIIGEVSFTVPFFWGTWSRNTKRGQGIRPGLSLSKKSAGGQTFS